jgi:hypothetical protein
MSGTPEADRLRGIIDLWKTVQDRLQPSVSVSGGLVETKSIGDSLESIADVLEQAESGKVDQILKSIHWPNITGQISSLQNVIQQIVNNGANQQSFHQQQAQPIVNAIWALRSALVWLLPPSTIGEAELQSPRLAELLAGAQKVMDVRKRVGEADRELASTLETLRQQIERSKGLVTEIEGFERTAANARTSAEASATTTKQTSEGLEALLNQQTESSKELTELLAQFQRTKNLVDETLEGTSKVALAYSFQQRRKALSAERWGWVVGFGLGIVALVLTGILVVPKVLGDVSQSGQSKYWEIVGHFLILGPIVWATWFAARKAGQTMRLAEDYAFKEAAAHSFVGYKREMGDDADMLHELRQYAIRNFGADPLRVLSDDEAASPLHDVINKLLERVDKLKPEEAMKAISELTRALGQVGSGK